MDIHICYYNEDGRRNASCVFCVNYSCNLKKKKEKTSGDMGKEMVNEERQEKCIQYNFTGIEIG